MQQFSPWIAGFPGLIWSIDIPHSRLKVFNRWSIPGLDVPRLLKDARYRKKAVRREVTPCSWNSGTCSPPAAPAAVTFRLTNGNGTYIPARLARRKRHALLRVPQGSLPPGGVFGGRRPGTCQMDIGGIGLSRLRARHPHARLLIINDAARSLFAAASRRSQHPGLADIAPAGLARKAA